MIDFLSGMSGRIAQLVARYAGAGLVAVGTYFHVTPDEATVQQFVAGVAAVVMFGVDLLIHYIRNKNKGAL
jgi:ABC-type Fe3+-siderophore transport system permease subunit